MGEQNLIISPAGQMRHIHSDELAELTAEIGSQTIRRASHVEPTNELDEGARAWLLTIRDDLRERGIPDNKWWADMRPVNGPVMGPFEKRDVALSWEVNWLHRHNIPVCETSRDSHN